jgi:hypothetical protein
VKERELPFLIRCGLSPSSCLFDYGCGLGPLAYAASEYLTTAGRYFGYEVNQGALKFLRRAYRDVPHFSFFGDRLRLEDDYIAISQKERRDGGVSAGQPDLVPIDRAVDMQWSHSVFTHMYPEPILKTLRAFTPHLAANSLCINTWLVVDEFAARQMAAGKADRNLCYSVNGGLTYFPENPLMCMGYELGTVRSIYEQAGHEILDMMFGSWAGRENGVTYIDIIVSRPKR